MSNLTEDSVAAIAPAHARLRPTQVGWAFFWGVVLLLVVGGIAYLLIGRATLHFQDADAKRALEREKILADRITEDHKWLNDPPSWFKKDQGAIRVPIALAMEMTVKQLQGVKPHAAGPIAAAPPAQNAAPTSPDKGLVPAGPQGQQNPGAANPTVAQPPSAPGSSQPAAPANAGAPNNAANPGNPPATYAGPSPTPAPSPSATAAPGASPHPGATPAGAIPPQQSTGAGPAPGSAPVPSPGPAAGSPPQSAHPVTAGNTPAPLAGPSPQTTPTNPPAGGATPDLHPSQPGATPGGTP